MVVKLKSVQTGGISSQPLCINRVTHFGFQSGSEHPFGQLSVVAHAHKIQAFRWNNHLSCSNVRSKGFIADRENFQLIFDLPGRYCTGFDRFCNPRKIRRTEFTEFRPDQEVLRT